MGITFGKRIKKLRMDANMTQEGLASLLGVSYQAVSHWETDISMPEISVIPKLADIFAVSADDILGIDSSKRDADINAVILEADKVLYSGDYPAAEDILRTAQRRHPRSFPIMVKLAEVLVYTNSHGEKSNFGEVITLCNTVLDKCRDNNLRNHALNSLAMVYYYSGDHYEMMKLVDQLPSFNLTREGFLVSRDGYTDDGLKTRHMYIHVLLGELFLTMSFLPHHTHDNGTPVYSKDEQLALFKQIIGVIEILFPDGDYGTMASTAAEMSEAIVHIYLNDGDVNNGLYWLNRAAEYYEYVSDADFSKSFTSPALKGYTRETITTSKWKESEAFCIRLLTESIYDSLRDDERFSAVTEKMRRKMKI